MIFINEIYINFDNKINNNLITYKGINFLFLDNK